MEDRGWHGSRARGRRITAWSTCNGAKQIHDAKGQSAGDNSAVDPTITSLLNWRPAGTDRSLAEAVRAISKENMGEQALVTSEIDRNETEK